MAGITELLDGSILDLKIMGVRAIVQTCSNKCKESQLSVIAGKANIE